MMEVELPENVNVVIETGGASVWQNDEVDPSKLQRWLYNSEGLQLLEDERALANMGDSPDAGRSSCDFASTNYPADRVAVTFWNHGGGSVSGAAFDELHGLDSLDLAEMYQAFDAVWPADKDDPALELIGFDTCLMATVDVAAVFRNFAKYLVASEEVEPANGWLLLPAGWGRLARGARPWTAPALGRAICDSLLRGLRGRWGRRISTTLSLTDLRKLSAAAGRLREPSVKEALAAAGGGPRLLRGAGPRRRTERRTTAATPGSRALPTWWTWAIWPGAARRGCCPAAQSCFRTRWIGLRALQAWAAPYRAEATGLSCYYSYNGDMDDLNGYLTSGRGPCLQVSLRL